MAKRDNVPGCFSGFFRRRNAISSGSENRAETAPGHIHGYGAEKSGQFCEGSPICDYSYGLESEWWFPDEELPAYSREEAKTVLPGPNRVIDSTLNELDASLRELSLKIHDHPELKFEERYAHDVLTEFMSENGFEVTKSYLGLETAWRAEFSYGKGGATVGVNAEMDALRGIGHACGHNLIAMSGVGVALALKAALKENRSSGKVVLLGTPAEEGGGGKAILLERGAYKDLDICLMCHPGPGPSRSANVGTSNAMQPIEVEFFGHTAHAAAAPWEGQNALDAAFLAYSGISVLRQQMKPDHRVHGIVLGRDWSNNVIPDYSRMQWGVRAPTYPELQVFVERVKNCFRAAALATSCRLEMKVGRAYYDLHPNESLATEFSRNAKKYGFTTGTTGTPASTDFGNICYALPSIHPMFAIPTTRDGGNHTAAFAKSARTQAAHDATMTVTKALALTGFRALTDENFLAKVKEDFANWKEGCAT